MKNSLQQMLVQRFADLRRNAELFKIGVSIPGLTKSLSGPFE